MSSQTGQLRQITFEADPAVAVGVPVWSPDGESIAFVSSKGRTGFDFGIWVVNPDGTNLRNVAERGLGMAWSPDGKWIYYAESSAGPLCKVPTSGGPPIRVRSEPMRNVIGLHAATLYYMIEQPLLDGRPEFGIRAATPEDGPSRALARVPASQVPDREPCTLAQRRVARHATDPRLHHEYLGSFHSNRGVASGDRLRRPRDLHRATGVVVLGRTIYSGRSCRRRCRHRVAEGIARPPVGALHR